MLVNAHSYVWPPPQSGYRTFPYSPLPAPSNHWFALQPYNWVPWSYISRISSSSPVCSLLSLGATHSSTIAWKIPWMEKPGRLQSMALQRVGHDWATSLSFFHLERTWDSSMLVHVSSSSLLLLLIIDTHTLPHTHPPHPKCLNFLYVPRNMGYIQEQNNIFTLFSWHFHFNGKRPKMDKHTQFIRK